MALCAWLGLLAAGAGADAPDAGVRAWEAAGARIVEAALPGSLVGEPAAAPGGVAVLLTPVVEGEDTDGEPEDDRGAPRSLWRFDPAGGGSLVELAGSLPPAIDAVDLLEADGGRQLIVGEPGVLYALGPLAGPAAGRTPRLLLEAPELDLGGIRRRGLIATDRLFVPRPRLGRLEIYRLNGAGALAPADDLPSLELPVRARRVSTGLVLSIPPLQLLERPDLPPLVAFGPEAQGRRRLLTTLVNPADPEATTEAWTRFSADEKVARSWYLSIDGRPMLAVAALAADKLGIFEKHKLRVFPLVPDRTRAGSPPALEIHTVTRNWYQLGVHVADLDRDGRDDLVVVQPDGLGAKKLAVEVYRGQGNGGFYLTPRRSVIVAPAARWTFGEDLDGDRVGDLVTLADGRLEIYRGLAESKRKALDRAPYLSLAVADLGADSDLELVIRVGDDGHGDDGRDWGLVDAFPPRIVDFDGDGRGEILLAGERGGRTLLWVIALR